MLQHSVPIPAEHSQIMSNVSFLDYSVTSPCQTNIHFLFSFHDHIEIQLHHIYFSTFDQQACLLPHTGRARYSDQPSGHDPLFQRRYLRFPCVSLLYSCCVVAVWYVHREMEASSKPRTYSDSNQSHDLTACTTCPVRYELITIHGTHYVMKAMAVRSTLSRSVAGFRVCLRLKQ